MAFQRRDIPDFAVNILARGTLGLMGLLPYRARVALFGRFFEHIVAPLAGWRKRVRDNLAYVMPDLPPAEVKRLERKVANNAGRSLIEIYSGEEFKRHAATMPITGPGLEAMKTAQAEGRPVVLVTGHFGNYDAPRAALIEQGLNIGALYRPMRNRFFNEHYTKSIAAIGSPVFPSSRKGQVEMIRFLRGGGVLGFFIDNHVGRGIEMDFFSKSAMTSLSAAQMALKYDALLLPVWGIRGDDGFSFEIRTGAPVQHTDAESMIAELTSQLEEITRDHMEQWFWIHRRWKPEVIEYHQRKRAAAKTGP
ncbi:lysophospholipid acyltransferase family protein [Halocynthiibacter styelae]|uniref:Lysophospholipid acyltransferase family protein n=1 Tax=Halocynthiibacter styelae TaxID=2761955 RepID=A0A8J7LW97_9RHOB|nr:lysophospholipid acyltransferase family protein [Paenihalocynthiibacter styelae]MBI1494047.1 lysophospholipid acyltransferase family protein [Paenihalocynthiibacter styelae]